MIVSRQVLRIVVTIIIALGGIWAFAQEGSFPYPPSFRDARVETYKVANDARLNLYIFSPPSNGKAQQRAAIVFFYGGGWENGSPAQFENQCRHLASLGMVAIAADYRVLRRQHTTVMDSVRDAKSAIRYVRQNAARLGIAPDRIAAAGGSSGGHLAAATGIIPGLDEPLENQVVSSRPNAMVLFNPIVILAPFDQDAEIARFTSALQRREEFQGVDPRAISPWQFVSGNAPPTIIFQGKADTTVPYVVVEKFTQKMVEAGNRCDLVGFEGQNHGFFNYKPGGNKYYDETVQRMDAFLASIGYLDVKSRDH